MSQQDRTTPPEAAEVRRLIAKGNAKSALDAAKLLHKRHNTPATEALLVETYLARARSLIEHDMPSEAEALIALARERYPSSAAMLDGALQPTAKQALEELVRPLADPAATAEQRRAVEQELRATLADPAALAACRTLAPDHPLRAAAAAVAQALEAVTGRAVSDAALDLPAISHRSPLAPWKPLLRAIACYYGRDDAACERNLAAIPADCAPARLASVLRPLIRRESDAALKPAAAGLAAQVGGSLAPLREALRDVDAAIGEDDRKQIMQAIRDAVSLAERDCPEIVPALRKQIAVRAWLLDLPPAKVTAAMGGSHRRDAQYLLQAARAMDVQEDSELEACLAWKDFLDAAIKEGWFPAKGPETATLYLHMAELAARGSDEDFDSLQEQARAIFRSFMGDELPDTSIPEADAGWLYEQACAMDPHAGAFARWLAWAESNKKKCPPASVAEAWRKALPADPRPLLWLMRDAEDRGALKKALGFLLEAEAVDGLNPEVPRARLRLMAGRAVQQLQQHNTRLAHRELDALAALPCAAEGDRPAFIAGLRFAAAVADRDEEAAAAQAREVGRMLGVRATTFALAGIYSLCKSPAGLKIDKARSAEGSWVEAAARVVAMGRDLGFTFFLPEAWEYEFRKELRGGTQVSPPMLEIFGEAALERGWNELAFAASVAGMAGGAAHEANFLAIRAQALPPWEGDRRDECLAAAMELARRQGNRELAGRVLEMRRRRSPLAMLGIDAGDLLTGHGMETVLSRERRARNYPRSRAEDDIFGLPVRPRPRKQKRRTPRPQAHQEELF